MQIHGSVALVTGANRGLGRHFVEQLRWILTASRSWDWDTTDPAAVATAARTADDVALPINNAGVTTRSELISGDLERIRLEMKTQFYGTLSMVRAFAPVLASNGGGAIVKVLSRLSWLSFPGTGAYAASKAAAWSLTNSVRLELAPQGTLVTGLLMGSTDTDTVAGLDIPKNDPADVVRAALDGVEAGSLEVVADEETAATKQALATDPAEVHRALLA